MVSKFINLWETLTAPRAIDESEARREHMANVILVGVGAVGGAYVVVLSLVYLAGGAIPVPAILGGAGALPLVPLGLWLSRRGRWRLAVLLPVLAFLAIPIYGQYYFGPYNVAIVTYGALVIIAQVAYGARVAVGVSLIGVISYAVLSLLWPYGQVPLTESVDVATRVIALSTSMGIILLLQWFFANQLKRALLESRTYAEELRRHRDRLEELVKERTADLQQANTQLQEEITERKQAEAEKERLLAAERAQAKRQAALLRLSAELAATLEEDEVCWRVVTGLRETLDYGVVVLMLLDETTGDRKVAAHVGYEGYDVELPARMGAGEGLSARPLEDGQLHYTPDVSREPGYYPGAWGSEVDVPVRIGGEVLGVLSVENQETDAFNQDDFELLTAAVQQAGLAIEKARLLASERARARRQASLLWLSTELAATLEESELCQRVIEGLHDTLGYDYVGLFLLDRSTGDRVCAAYAGFEAPLTRLRPGEGLSEAPLLDGQLQYTPDVTQDPRYVAGAGGSEVDVPVRIGGEVLGVLIAESQRRDAFAPDDLQVLSVAANQVGLAIGKARLLAAERKRADELDALRTTMADITAKLELSTVLQAIVERAAGLLDAAGGELGLYDDQEVRIVVSRGLGEGYVGTTHKLGEGAMGQVAQTGQGLIVEDYATWEGRPPRYADSPYRGVMAAPLQIGSRLVGVIAVGNTDPYKRFGDADLRLLTMFAQQATIAIENARLLAAERQRGDELEALRTTMADITAELGLSALLEAIVERAKALLGVDTGELGLYEAEQRQLRIVVSHEEYVGTCHRLGEGAMGRVAATGEPLIIEDYQAWEGRVQQYAHLHASMTTPLQVGGRLVGVISVASSDPERQFEDADLRLLNLFAHQAAIAIQNARLFGETERRAAEMATLTDVGKALSSTLRVEEVLELIYEQTRRVMHAEDMLIALYDEAKHEIECGFSTNPDDTAVGERFPADTGATGYVIKQRKSLLARGDAMQLVRDLGIDIVGQPAESWLGVPMLVGDRVLGVIVVQHYTKPNVYDESHQALLETIASQAAIAIENARLYDQAQQEIAERKRAEEELRTYQEHLQELVDERTAELRESEERYRSLFDGVPVGLYRTTPEGNIVDVNPAMTQMMGVQSKAEALATRGTDYYVNPEDRVRWQELMAAEEGIVRDFEVQWRRPDGTVFWVNDTARAVRDEQGQVLYYEGSMEDISERKRAEEELRDYQEHLEELVEQRTAELRESEERYRTLFDGVPMGLYRTTPEGQALVMNQAARQMFRFPSRADLASANAVDYYVNPDDRRRWQELMEREGVVQDFEEQLYRYDGTVIWVSDSARAVKDEQGKVLHYEGSLKDITERKRAEAELQQAKEAAEAANQAKSRFLANMSHELRTPLNAIIGFTRLVKRRSTDTLPQKQLDNLDKVLVSADHLLGLINDILDLSKIEAGRTEVQPASFEVEPLVDACIQTVRPLVKTQNLRLVKDVEPDLPAMLSDQDKARQILINLLSNAVKFTEEGTVTVSAQRQGEMLVLAVKDTGIGIPEDALERIFEAFQQVDGSTTRRYGGTGLGLSISRQLARLLGGDIQLESTLGEGSTFTVTLPLRYEAAPPAGEPAPVTEPLSEEPTAQRDGRPVVLSIDDDPNVIYLLQENLADAGYRVVGARSGAEGVQKARALKPFAILLDILMSPQDGWQVLHDLKADATTRDIPVMILSIVDNRELGYRLGAYDYLVKPFDREAILSALARIAPREETSEAVQLLVVDDDPHVVDLVTQLLGDEPYSIRSAADGKEALDLLSRQCPDIILLDLLMPRLDGFGVIEWLRQSAEHCDIPVIVLTAKELGAEELAQLQQSVSTVIQKKGLESEVLLQELRSALRAYHHHAEPSGGSDEENPGC